MQSIKNTTVTIILLFLSYGVYQVLTKPLPSEMRDDEFQPLAIADPVDQSIPANLIDDIESPRPQNITQNSNVIPPQLLEIESSERSDFSQGSTSMAPQPNFPIEQASGQNQFQSEFEPTTLPGSATKPYDPKLTHLESDSKINPSTVMAPVAERTAGPGNEYTSTTALPPLSAEPITLAKSWSTINQLVENSEFKQALESLSIFYQTGNYEAFEEPQLHEWLDALAAKVIYSSEHNLRATPYVIQPGDTIGSLARNWNVPAQLIYNINVAQIPDPNDLQPGVEIKLVEGPFDAVIDSEEQRLTLYLDRLYAGRFTIHPGNRLEAGEFQIVDKSAQDHLDRPFWIALNNGGSIFASDTVPSDTNEIGMAHREAEEIFSILSATSKIKVIR